jgi:phosphoketolase
VNSSTKGMAFGNILFGGPIGAGVDMASGAAYDYPNLITVMMGTTATVGTPAQEPPKN